MPKGSALPGLPRLAIVVLGGLSAFGPLSTDLYLPALPATAASLGTSAATIQVTLTASVIGLGAGQLVVGPLSDRHGRRRPLILGLLLFIAFSLGCAAAPNIAVLIAMRFGQALGGSAGLVLARATVRDRVAGEQLRKAFSMLTIISSLAPILAPLIGSQLIRFMSWRGDFLLLACVGGALLVGALRCLPESLPADRREPGGLRPVFVSYRSLLRDGHFVRYVGVFALACGVLFAYIAQSPFTLQDVHGLSAQTFGLVFAFNSICIMTCSRIRLARPERNLCLALTTTATAVLFVTASFVTGALATLLIGFALICCGWGLLAPSATALILVPHPRRAGAASAVQGAAQFLVAGAVGPVVGVDGGGDLLPLVTVMAVLTTGAIVLLAMELRRHSREPMSDVPRDPERTESEAESPLI